MEPFIHYGNIRLLNVPHAKEVADEVITEDCYRVSEFPVGARVLDVGAFYGEFAVMAAVTKNCQVDAYEPSSASSLLCYFNSCANGVHYDPDDATDPFVASWNQAVGKVSGMVEYNYNPAHPAGSTVGNPRLIFSESTVTQISIAEVIQSGSFDVVKLDCEGSEFEIFSDPIWMDNVKIVTMEFHDHDGDYYAGILRERGFNVDVTGSGPRPRPQWDKSMTGGLLFATKL